MSGQTSSKEYVSDRVGKPIFVGEWGIANSMEDPENIRYMEEIVSAMKAAKIQLSAVWVFGLKDHSTGQKWDISQDGDRNIYFKKLRELNGLE